MFVDPSSLVTRKGLKRKYRNMNVHFAHIIWNQHINELTSKITVKDNIIMDGDVRVRAAIVIGLVEIEVHPHKGI